MNERICDMHCHILPGVDDGAENLDTSRRMLELAWRDGIRTIIATPHYHPVKGKAGIDRWQAALEAVQTAAGQIDSRIRVLPGCEIWYRQGIEELLLQKKVWTMCGSRYVLTEFSSGVGFSAMSDGLLNLQRSGFYPILAHIERYACLDEPEKVEALLQMRVYLQMNADTVLRGQELLRGRYVRTLLKRGYIHFVATDAHDLTRRRPQMKKSWSYISKLCGREYADTVCGKNALRVVTGERIPFA